MAIVLEFIDFIVSRSLIEERYPGGWQGCIDDNENLIGGRVWFDDYLFRDGAMNPMDIQEIEKFWQGHGFETQSRDADGNLFWKDVCVVEGMLGGPTLPCDWIVVDQGTAYLRGTEPGAVRGRDA